MALATIKSQLPGNFQLTKIASVSGNDITLDSDTGIPTTTGFSLVIWDKGKISPIESDANPEIVTVSAISSGTYTLTRAQEGTTQRTIAADDYVAWSITAGWLSDLIDDIVAAARGAGTGLSLSGNNLVVDDPYSSTEKSKLANIAPNAEVNPSVVPQAEAIAGSSNAERIWTAQRVNQAIDAVYTPTEKTKLGGIETGADVNVGQEYTQTEKTKLSGIETSADANVGVEYSQTEKTKVGNLDTDAQVPSGGSANQVLEKLTGTDYDTGWATLTGAGTTQTITGTVRTGTPAVGDPVAQNTNYSAAHGLGAVPDLVNMIATCKIAERGYAIGDVVTLNNDKDRLGLWANATNVGFSTFSNRGTPYILFRNNQDGSNLTAANWKLEAVPYVYEDQEVVGLTGPSGGKGDKGDTGAAGAAGAKGDMGDAGAAGAAGATGAAGTAGTNGTNGTNGTAGTAGADGGRLRLSLHTDGERRVVQIEGVDNADGTYTANTTATYMGASGATTTLADAVDIRGAAGTGTTQTAAQIVTALEALTGDARLASTAIKGLTSGGETRTELFSASFNVTSSSAKLTGDIVCPSTGDLEIYARQTTGDRQGSIVSVRMPAADLYSRNTAVGTAFDNDDSRSIITAHGTNRGFSLTNATADHHIQVAAQSGGDFEIRITHIT